jgi:hypothetical protein
MYGRLHFRKKISGDLESPEHVLSIYLLPPPMRTPLPPPIPAPMPLPIPRPAPLTDGVLRAVKDGLLTPLLIDAPGARTLAKPPGD